MGKPRIAESDYLEPEELLLDPELQVDWQGEVFPWLRTPMSREGHLLAPDGMTAYCGLPLYPPPDFLWDGVRHAVMTMARGRVEGKDGDKLAKKHDPGEYYIARDRRKGNKCAGCKPKKGMPIAIPSRWDEPELLGQMEEAMERPAKRGPLTRSERVLRQRFLSNVARITREFGGTIER